MVKRVLKTLTIRQKLKILSKVNRGVKKKEVANKFKIPPSTLTAILKRKDKIIEKSQRYENLNVKRIRHPKNGVIERAVLNFITKAREANVPLTGAIVQAKAKKYAELFDVPTFKASSGWLSKLKKKHRLNFKIISGESAAVDKDAVNEWYKRLPNIIKDYEPNDIFNADETALFWKCLPQTTLAFKNENCYGGKLNKVRVTVLIGANCSGTEKLPLLVIGKSIHPRCFKHKQIPVKYDSNKTAWMTKKIFKKYMKELDAEFTNQQRKVLFFVDNFSGHSKTLIRKLKSIKLVFFPPNMTSKVQAMDAGIIKNFKVHYRTKLVNRLIDQIDNDLPVQDINLFDAVSYMTEAWDQVTPQTIANCFKHVKVFSNWVDEDDVPLSQLSSTVERVNECIDVTEHIYTINEPANWLRLQDILEFECTFEDYLHVDQNIVMGDILNDRDIIRFALETQTNTVSDDYDDNKD